MSCAVASVVLPVLQVVLVVSVIIYYLWIGLDQFLLWCLCHVLHIKWWDWAPNTDNWSAMWRYCCNLRFKHATCKHATLLALRLHQLGWSRQAHVDECYTSKVVFYGQLASGSWLQGAQQWRWLKTQSACNRITVNFRHSPSNVQSGVHCVSSHHGALNICGSHLITGWKETKCRNWPEV